MIRITLIVNLLVWIAANSGWCAQVALPGVRVLPLNDPGQRGTGFTLLPPDQTGVRFTNSLDEWAGASNRVLNNGSGVALGDFDNDGWVDLFFCSLAHGNRLFKNLGNWQFQDVTEQAGLRFAPGFYRAAVFADVNGDGWLDLLVGSASQGVFCFLNDQRGHFTDATALVGIAGAYANETLALADIDGNGTLDLYACNNRADDIRDWPRVPVVLVNKRPTVPPQLRNRITFENGTLQEYGEPDMLFLNDGRGRFRPVSWTGGTFLDEEGNALKEAPLDWGLTAAFRDLNNDGAPDLYVCNDYWTPDRVWLNDGHGRFRAMDSLSIRKTPASSMGVDFADVNRDGHLDIFAVDMLSRSLELRRRQTVAKRAVAPRVGEIDSRIQTPRNTLLLNRGDGTFAEIACLAGVEASDWSWSPIFLDVDLDGYDDLLVTAGHLRDIQDLDANEKLRAQQEGWRRSPMAATNLIGAFVAAKHEHAKFYPPLDMPVIAFRNLGNLRFEEVTAGWRLNVPGVNHGIALADLDNDGDLDLIVNRLGAPAAIFRNDAIAARIAVRLRGKAPNTQAIGAKIELLAGASSNQIQEVTCGGHYMSGCDTLRVFAPGSAKSGLGLRVIWRDGSTTDVPKVEPNRLYEIDEAQVPHSKSGTSQNPNPPPMFEDVSSLITHVHSENNFDDFARQPLLPRKLSQSGPGVAWFDWDGDGWEDLIIGSGKGGQLALFLNRQGQNFERAPGPPFDGKVPHDQTTVLGWNGGLNQRALLAGSASYEDNDSQASCVLRYDAKSGQPQSLVPGQIASVGPIALGDIDGDGDLDLFVGGQVIPGKYPQPAGSLLFRNFGGKFQLDEEASAVLAGVGLVNSAVWTDLDGDGLPELVLATEWGPLRIFSARGGKLLDVTREWGLAEITGLWTGVAAGDFDGDGRLDLVAGNWGLNSFSGASQPAVLFYGDIAGQGKVDILEAEFDPAARELVPHHLRDPLAGSLPFLVERFPTHAAYSRATMADIIADRPAKKLQASTLASTVFLNRGGRFEARALPDEAQFAPAFGVCVADFDGDGKEDLFLSQNFFAFRVEDSRLDSGRGLLLRGDGQGNFVAVPGQASGMKVYGEQRGAAVADFDHDGRADLVVTQNGTATKLYRNTSARPGVRVRVVGPEQNPDGMGAVIRLQFGEQWGPARELHAGSGWWSQDAVVPVMGLAGTVTAIRVRFPGGRTVEKLIEPEVREVTIRTSGEARQ